MSAMVARGSFAAESGSTATKTKCLKCSLTVPTPLPDGRAMILAELGRLEEAIAQLETYLQQETSGWDQARVSAIIDVLRRR